MDGSSFGAAICSAIGLRRLARLIVGGSLLFLGACSPRSEPAVNAPQAQQNRADQPVTGQEFKQRQITFLNRIRDADPQQKVIDRAMLNEQNELGLIRSQRGNEQNPGLDADFPDANGVRIPRSRPDLDCVYAIKPAFEGGHGAS